MGLFSPNLNGMGPDGHQVYEPVGKIGRFFRLLSQNGRGIMASGFLTGLSSAVYILAMALAIKYRALIFMLIGAPLGGLVLMPQLVGTADTIFRAMRGEAGFWWENYKRAWKRNFRACVAPGLLMGLVFGFQLMMLRQGNSEDTGVVIAVAMLVVVALCTAIAKWTVLQIAVVDLPIGRLLLNSIVLSSNHPIKTLVLTVLEIVYWLFIVVAYPFSLLFYVLFNFWLTMLITVLTLYKPMNETFGIEKAVEEQKEREKQRRKSEGK